MIKSINRLLFNSSNSILGVAGQSKIMSTLGLEDAKKIVAFHAVDELLQVDA